MPRLLLVIVLVLVLGLTAEPATCSDFVLVEGPEPGSEQVRDVGDAIYWISDQVPSLVLTEPFRAQIRKKLAANAPAGTVLTEWAPGRPGWACSAEGSSVVAGSMLGVSLSEPICMRDTDADGRFDEFFVGPGGTQGSGTVSIEIEGRGPAYREGTAAHEGSFRRELVFLGVDGATLRIQYREFRGKSIRPAFDQLLTYPLEDGRCVVRYRGLELRVDEVRDGRMRYAVASGIAR